MSFHSIFKKTIGESTFANRHVKENQNVNEASDSLTSEEMAFGWLTRNNVLPQVFRGVYNGLRVPAASKPGSAIPVWRSLKYTTYPFVGINGYSNVPAMEAKHGNEASYMSGGLRDIDKSSVVRNILASQVAAGTGIPENVFLMFPQMPISSAGTGKSRRSQSVFAALNTRDSYRRSISPYHVQQALKVDGSGRLVPAPGKKGGVVLRPMKNSSGIMKASKLTDGDLYNLADLDHRGVLATAVTGSAEPNSTVPGGLISPFVKGHTIGHKKLNDLIGGNPNYMRLDDFAAKNGFLTEDGDVDFMEIRNWILEADASEIIDSLIKPYLLKSPFEQTYCWRVLDMSERLSMRDDVRVYEALIGRRDARTAEDAPAEAEPMESPDGGFEFDEESAATANDGMEESVVVSVGTPEDAARILGEAKEENSPMIDEDSMRKEIMAVCKKYVSSHQNTFGFVPKMTYEGTTRDDGRINTYSRGEKKTFARILTKNTQPMELDIKFCPEGVDGMKRSYSGVLDFSPLFEQFAGSVDQNMPKKFKFERIVGYMVSYKFDEEIEDEYKKSRRGLQERNLGKLRYYADSPNSVQLREPVVFDVTYIKGGEYGDFLFSSYERPPVDRTTQMGGQPPAEIISNRLYADSVDGLHSEMVHDLGRVNLPYRYNTSVH